MLDIPMTSAMVGQLGKVVANFSFHGERRALDQKVELTGKGSERRPCVRRRP